jgi:hypothetical protein
LYSAKETTVQVLRVQKWRNRVSGLKFFFFISTRYTCNRPK